MAGKAELLILENEPISIIELLKLYSKMSTKFPHGSRKGKEMNPDTKMILDYYIAYKAPKDRKQLEALIETVNDNKDFLENVVKKHPELKHNQQFYSYGTPTYISAAIKRVVDERFSDVTDGPIGAYKEQLAKSKKVAMYVGAGCLVFILISVVLFILALISE